jgi:hypothetical protein
MVIRTGIAIGLLLVLGRDVDAQKAGSSAPLPPGHRSSTAGVYTLEQATRGADAYAGMCTGCHTTAAHMGDVFVSNWAGRPVGEFFGFIRSAMPKNEPGSLSADEYASIVAYILKLNGMPAGQEALPSDSAALQKIRFDSPKK